MRCRGGENNRSEPAQGGVSLVSPQRIHLPPRQIERNVPVPAYSGCAGGAQLVPPSDSNHDLARNLVSKPYANLASNSKKKKKISALCARFCDRLRARLAARIASRHAAAGCQWRQRERMMKHQALPPATDRPQVMHRETLTTLCSEPELEALFAHTEPDLAERKASLASVAPRTIRQTAGAVWPS